MKQLTVENLGQCYWRHHSGEVGCSAWGRCDSDRGAAPGRSVQVVSQVVQGILIRSKCGWCFDVYLWWSMYVEILARRLECFNQCFVNCPNTNNRKLINHRAVHAWTAVWKAAFCARLYITIYNHSRRCSKHKACICEIPGWNLHSFLWRIICSCEKPWNI